MILYWMGSKFQSTLPRGERPGIYSGRSRGIDFNPRSRVGSDLLLFFHGFCLHDFNPRSRVGSDAKEKCAYPKAEVFQSTLPRGERPESSSSEMQVSKFQSTLPRGERPLLLCTSDSDTDFNPRSRVGSDPIRPTGSLWRRNFNPRSRVGSDSADKASGGFTVIFQSTLPRGERPSSTQERADFDRYFNPRSRVGSD